LNLRWWILLLDKQDGWKYCFGLSCNDFNNSLGNTNEAHEVILYSKYSDWQNTNEIEYIFALLFV
jgi:hypothetical protein